MLAQTSANHTPNSPFIILSKVESTNNYAMAKLHAGLLPHGSCLLALHQTSGKGQRGKRWLSNAGENITMSTVFSLSHLFSNPTRSNLLAYPFLLSAAAALGCYDFIKAYNVPNLTVKWPNDVYSGDRKAAGILIENSYTGASWQWAVIGTGVNLNQEHFDIPGSNAISIKMATGESNDLVIAGKALHFHLTKSIDRLTDQDGSELMEEYNTLLYKRGSEMKFRKGTMLFTSRIEGVNRDGQLITKDVVERKFNVGEVDFV